RDWSSDVCSSDLHLGKEKMQAQLQRRAYWVGWRADVQRFCQSCDVCCRYHRGGLKRQGPLQATAVGNVWDRVSIDLAGPHTTSKSGNIYILTVLDHFSKWDDGVQTVHERRSGEIPQDLKLNAW